MKRRSSLRWTGASPSGALPALGSLLAGLMTALAFSIAVSGCASGTSGTSQPAGRGGALPPPGPSVYEIITELELEPEQLPEVRGILENAEDERDAIMAAARPPSGGGSRSGDGPDSGAASSLQAKLATLRIQTEDALSDVLTPVQMAKYREMMEEAEREREAMRSQMRGGRPGGGGPGGRW